LPGGGIRIGHGRHSRGHDDFADAMALVVSEASNYVEWGEGYAVGELEAVKLFGDYSSPLLDSYDRSWDRY